MVLGIENLQIKVIKGILLLCLMTVWQDKEDSEVVRPVRSGEQIGQVGQ